MVHSQIVPDHMCIRRVQTAGKHQMHLVCLPSICTSIKTSPIQHGFCWGFVGRFLSPRQSHHKLVASAFEFGSALTEAANGLVFLKVLVLETKAIELNVKVRSDSQTRRSERAQVEHRRSRKNPTMTFLSALTNLVKTKKCKDKSLYRVSANSPWCSAAVKMLLKIGCARLKSLSEFFQNVNEIQQTC